MKKVIKSHAMMAFYTTYRDKLNAAVKSCDNQDDLAEYVEAVGEGLVAALPLMHEHLNKLVDIPLERFLIDLTLKIPQLGDLDEGNTTTGTACSDSPILGSKEPTELQASVSEEGHVQEYPIRSSED